MSHELLPIATRKETFRVLMRLLSTHRVPMAGALLAFALAGVAGLVPPWMLGTIVDDVRSGRDTIAAAALIIAGASLAGALFGGLSVALLARAGEPALSDLRTEVLDNALHLDAARIESAGTGDLLSRVGDDVRTVARGLNDVVPTLVNSVIAIGFTAIGLFALDWRLAFAVLGTVPFYAQGLRWYLPRSAPYYRQERVAHGERAEALISGIQSAPTARAFGIEGIQLARVEQSSQTAVQIAVTVFRLLLRFLGRNNRAELVGIGLVLAVGFLLVRGDLTTVGAVTAAALYFLRLFNPIGGLLFMLDEVQSTGASLSRLAGVALMTRPAEPTSAPAAERGELVLAGVTHEYVDGKPVLHETTLRIAAGERVAIVGATGAGKTTLGAIAAGVLQPSTGTVTLAGRSFADLGERAVRSRVSLISQDVHVFSGTVRDSVTLVRPDALDTEVEQSLAAAEADRWVAALPEGLDTVVGDRGHPLTPAQAQQLALARIVLQDPWVVILDEATAEAGSAGARELEKAAYAVTEGRTALVVAHRLTQSQSADRVIVMHDGVIVEQGAHDELLAAGGRYAELWGAWSAR